MSKTTGKGPPRGVNRKDVAEKEMLEDLARSGLDEKDAELMGCAADAGGYDIPYLDVYGKPTGFVRKRWLRNQQGGGKYTQPKGSKNRLYFPPQWRDWKKVLDDPSTPIVIVEGEKKAAALCKAGIPAVGIGGKDNWANKGKVLLPELVAIAQRGRDLHIAFDSDIATNLDIQRAQRELARCLHDHGAKVHAITFQTSPAGEKVGADDFLVAEKLFAKPKQAHEAIFKLSTALTEGDLIDPIVVEMNKTLFVLDYAGRVRVARFRQADEDDAEDAEDSHDLKLYRKEDFTLWMQNQQWSRPSDGKLMAKAEHWLNSPDRRQYSEAVFRPNAPAVVGTKINTWRGWQYERPADGTKPAGSWQLFKDHIFVNLCRRRKDVYEWKLNWMARTVQYPDLPAETAIVLYGAQGAGKSFFADMFATPFQPYVLSTAQKEQVIGKHNVTLERTIILIGEEAFFADFKRDHAVLKDLITTKRLNVEPKNYEIRKVRSHLHLIIISNADRPIHAEAGERRFLVLKVGEEHVQDTNYFQRIEKQLKEEGGFEAMMYELQHRNIDDPKWDHRKVPHTEELDEQKQATLFEGDPLKVWLLDVLDRGWIYQGSKLRADAGSGTWVTRVNKELAFAAYANHAGVVTSKGSVTSFWQQIRGIFPGLPKRDERCRAKDDPGTYTTFPSLDECRDQFAKSVGFDPWKKSR